MVGVEGVMSDTSRECVVLGGVLALGGVLVEGVRHRSGDS
jgi:hypothetical protein